MPKYRAIRPTEDGISVECSSLELARITAEDLAEEDGNDGDVANYEIVEIKERAEALKVVWAKVK